MKHLKNKKNIHEEINKMKSLFHAKTGEIIFEQNDLNQINKDIDDIRDELDDLDSDEEKIVNIIKKYTKPQSFDEFRRYYQNRTKQNLEQDLSQAIDPVNDKKEYDNLTAHLKNNLGLNVQYVNSQIKLLNADDSNIRTERQSTINSTFCGFQDFNKWIKYVNDYGVNKDETLLAINSCPETMLSQKLNTANARWNTDPNVRCVKSQKGALEKQSKYGDVYYMIDDMVYWSDGKKNKSGSAEYEGYNCKTEFKLARAATNAQSGGGQTSYNQKIAKSAAELGIQNGNMDTKTLQAILDQLNSTGLQASPSVSSVSVNPDDPNSLMAILNQLNNLS